MHHCKVSVKCHECEEEDGAVEADEVSTADHLTQNQAKNPIRQMVHRPEWETRGKEKVGEDQIQEEDVCHCAELLKLEDNEEHEPVTKVTQEEVGIVEHWDESCTKLIDILLWTEHDTVTDQIARVSRVIVVTEYVHEDVILVFRAHGCGLTSSAVRGGR